MCFPSGMWSNSLLILCGTQKVRRELIASTAEGKPSMHLPPGRVSVYTHKAKKIKIKSNVPGLIILKQIQPRTYALAGFFGSVDYFPIIGFISWLAENMIEQSRVIFSWPMICLKRPLHFFCVCHFTMELWNWAWEKKTRIQTQSALSVSSSSWFVSVFYFLPTVRSRIRPCQVILLTFVSM